MSWIEAFKGWQWTVRRCYQQVSGVRSCVGAGEKEGIRGDWTMPRNRSLFPRICCACGRSGPRALSRREERFKEGQKKEIELPEYDADVFEAFVYFLFGEELLFNSSPYDLQQRLLELKLSFRMWAFADKYLLPKLQNAAMRRVCDVIDDRLYSCRIDATTLGDCFRTTREGSPLSMVVGDYCVERIKARGASFGMGDGLGSCSGFLAALHSLEAAFHQLPREDFPRFLKSVKYLSLFDTKLDLEIR